MKNKIGKTLAAGYILFCMLANLGSTGAIAMNVSPEETAQNLISEVQAKEIALKKVKGTVSKVEIETENGVQKYEVYIKTSTDMYEVEIDATTGKVLKVEKED